VLESSTENDPVVINLNTSLGDNINLNLMADSESEDEMKVCPYPTGEILSACPGADPEILIGGVGWGTNQK